jgi:hypothetical protein
MLYSVAGYYGTGAVFAAQTMDVNFARRLADQKGQDFLNFSRRRGCGTSQRYMLVVHAKLLHELLFTVATGAILPQIKNGRYAQTFQFFESFAGGFSTAKNSIVHLAEIADVLRLDWSGDFGRAGDSCQQKHGG